MLKNLIKFLLFIFVWIIWILFVTTVSSFMYDVPMKEAMTYNGTAVITVGFGWIVPLIVVFANGDEF